ncbi:MAG TPA: hypothetical protein VHY08_17385, partial [Bacillota bacterium]|nr:hypothetical protein [Bacillota bacterium]
MEKQMAAPQQTLQDQQSNGPETPKAPKQPMSISVILGLQKTIGNRAVQRLLDPSMIQRQTPPSQLSMPQMRYNPRQSQSFFPDLTYAPHLTSSDQGFIDSFLTEHRLAVSPLFQMMLDGQLTTLDAIVDALRPHILSMIPRSEIENYVGTRFVRIAIPFVARIGPPAPQNIPNDLRPAPSARTSVTLGGAYSGHFNLMVGRPDPHDWTVQVQVAREGGIQRLMLFTYNC